MKTSDFVYDLPESLIAQHPIEPRDNSRLLCYNKNSQEVEHKIFRDVLSYLQKGDVLVVNNTRVLPARLFGTKRGSGGKFEFLLLKRIDYVTWEVILRPGKKAKVGTIIDFSPELSAEIIDRTPSGERIVKFLFTGVFEDILSRTGEMPLPHYIHEKLIDNSRYQTVYSKIEGSSAAPTAGLHFTDALLQEIKNMGVQVVEVLLHVGLGTFRPLKCEDVTMHKMHSEYYEISSDAVQQINLAKEQNRRVIAVGTTSVRVLESCACGQGMVASKNGETDIFIYPGYKFKIIDGLITNFHLPESTLIMLVSAFIGREKTLELYKLAVQNEYRFFSFGDAMLIL